MITLTIRGQGDFLQDEPARILVGVNLGKEVKDDREDLKRTLDSLEVISKK